MIEIIFQAFKNFLRANDIFSVVSQNFNEKSSLVKKWEDGQ